MTTSVGDVFRSNTKKETAKTKQFLHKLADRSLFKYEILSSTKQAIVFEANRECFIDLVKQNDDGSISPKNRATLSFDALLGLRSLIPVIKDELTEGTTSCHLLDKTSDLYVFTSKLPDRTQFFFRNYGNNMIMLTNIHHKYEKTDGSMTEGVSIFV